MQPRLDAYLNRLSGAATATAVNRERANILSQCRRAAAWEPGLFSLTVPTGGGKTLSSLAFGIDHALKHGLKRVIYVIPYTSIIEQNAQVFRDVFGEDEGKSPVLEHHSNFEPDAEDPWSRRAAENWDAPLVVTTSVQFLESIFSHRTGSSRKLHNIAESVVILDEAQMLPPPLLQPTLRMVDELSTTYRSSVVLCTATQPAVECSDEFPSGLEGVREIITDPSALFSALKRTHVQSIGVISDEELAARVAKHDQALVVVNTRGHARQLFETVRMTTEASTGAPTVHHLSALMYPAHRSRVLATVRSRLEAGEPVILVSTQLIEAGVDIDFPVVYRACAGLDSIAQAAGRCNREGRREQPGDVIVFEPASGGVPRQFRAAVAAMETVARRHADLLAPAAVHDYFREYYWRKGKTGGLDAKKIMQRLTPRSAGQFHIPFRDISRDYRVIDESMVAIIINRGGGTDDGNDVEAIVERLAWETTGWLSLRRLQRYTVQVPERVLASFVADGAVDEARPGVYVLNNYRAYDESVGLMYDQGAVRDPGSMFV